MFKQIALIFALCSTSPNISVSAVGGKGKMTGGGEEAEVMDRWIHCLFACGSMTCQTCAAAALGSSLRLLIPACPPTRGSDASYHDAESTYLKPEGVKYHFQPQQGEGTSHFGGGGGSLCSSGPSRWPQGGRDGGD
ncbi:hypothetical protein JOQ06_004979, partial [Pogonophryne albipinna]